MLALDVRIIEAICVWFSQSKLNSRFLLRGIWSDSINESFDPDQVARILKSLAKQAQINPKSINGHSTRIGAAQDLLKDGKSISQIMEQVGWKKIDTVMRYLRASGIGFKLDGMPMWRELLLQKNRRNHGYSSATEN